MNEKIMKAFCWRTGLIQIAPEVPEGALELATAPGDLLARAIDAIARHSRDNCDYLVPGVPEAADGDAAVDAVLDFRDALEERIGIALLETQKPEGGRDVSTASRI